MNQRQYPAIAELKRAIKIKEKIKSLTAELERILDRNGVPSLKRTGRRGGLSAAGRAAIRAAQKARWAKLKRVRRRKG